MTTWEYKVTTHLITELKNCVDTSEKRTVIACDQSGSCMVHDVCEIGTRTLAAALNELGGQGWELIMNTYHRGQLLCMWKRPRGQSSQR
jgi:hypothetical protein